MWTFIDTDEHLVRETLYIKPAVYSLDIEATGLDPYTDTILLIQVGLPTGEALIIDARKVSNTIIASFLEVLYGRVDSVILHNAKYDVKMLMHNYDVVPPKGVLYDTALAETILYNGLISPYVSLKKLLKKYLAVEADKEIREEFIGYTRDDFDDELLDYAAKDVIYLFDICSSQQYFLHKNELLEVARLEFDLIPAISYMELKGVYLDTKKWLDIYRETLAQEKQLAEELIEMAKGVVVDWTHPKTGKVYHYDFGEEPINLNSSQQLRGLFKFYGYDLDSADAATLGGLTNSEFAVKLLEYKKCMKRTSTYGAGFLDNVHPVTHRIHSSFNQTGTYSGRLSSDSPNLQNIPARDTKAYRNCFVAPPGRKLVTGDYSQIELRLAAEFSGDEKFIDAYKNGADLHQMTADIIGRSRQDGKTLNFTILYGASGFRVAGMFGITPAEGDEIIARWKQGFTKLNDWIEAQEKFLMENGYNVTATGRRRYWEMPSRNDPKYWGKVSKNKREAVNHPIQGTSADMVKIAITNIFYALYRYDAYPILTVHDEIVVECPEEIKDEVKTIMDREMLRAAEMFISKIPVAVDSKIGEIWGH